MADETSLDETSIALILVGAFVMIFGIVFTADSFVTNPIFKGYDPFVKLLLGLFFLGSGAILVAVSKKGHEKVEVKTYPGVSVGVGVIGFVFGMLLFLDGWSRYNNPLYPFASQAVKTGYIAGNIARAIFCNCWNCFDGKRIY